MDVFASSSSESLPRCTRWRAAVAAKGLLMEPAWNSVSGVTGASPMLSTPRLRTHAIFAWLMRRACLGIFLLSKRPSVP